MKSKLRLNIEQLSVESFAIAGAEDGMGTVRGHGIKPPAEPASDWEGPCGGSNYASCNGSCGATCYQTCYNTCGASCNASCVYTCQLSCHSVCHEPAETNNCY